MKSAITFLMLIVILAMAPQARAATQTVYQNGEAVVTVPVSQYINVFTGGSSWTKVYQQLGGPSNNSAPHYQLLTGGAISNQEAVFGPFTTATNVKIEAGTDGALYSVGALAVPIYCIRPGTLQARTQVSPVTYNTTSTVLATDMMIGILTSTQSTGSTITLSLPTGTLTDAAAGLQIGQAFPWTLINLSTSSGNTVTLGAGTGHTIVGDAITQASALSTGCSTSRWLTRKTAANTFVTYRQ
jgi:hypothetical protein